MISSQSSQTLEALNAKNISVLEVTAMNVEEIVTELTQFHRKKGLKVDHP
ncbi:hypothetical protein [Thermoflavimicrobium dichotomicum]|nr:hypothetical protein [Thermoflavimicrobium dichotomicum]